MAESTDNLGGPQGSGAAPTNLGETLKGPSFLDRIKAAFNLGKEGKVAADKGTEHVLTLNGFKEQLEIAKNNGADAAHIANIEKDINDTAGKLNQVKGEAFSKSFRSTFEKGAAMAGGNLRSAGKGELVLRGGGVLVGIGGLVSATNDVFRPKKDANGQRETSWVKTGLKAIGSAALVVASVVAGGKNRAMGI